MISRKLLAGTDAAGMNDMEDSRFNEAIVVCWKRMTLTVSMSFGILTRMSLAEATLNRLWTDSEVKKMK